MYNPQIYELLDAYNADTLYEILKATTLLEGTSKKPAKARMIELMTEKYFTRERVLSSYDKLNRPESKVLERLQQYGGEMATHSLERMLERGGITEPAPANPRFSNLGYSGSPYKNGSKVFRDLLARLTYHGLVFSKATTEEQSPSYKFTFDPGGTVYIPPLVRRHLPEPPPLTSTFDDFIPASIKSGDGQLFLRNLYLYWDFVRRTPVDLLQSGMVGKRSLKAINSVLLQPDPLMDTASKEEETPTLYFLRQILQGLKLLKVELNKLQVVESKDSTANFWSLSAAEQAVSMVQAWINLPTPIDVPEASRRFATYNIKAARTQLVELLRQRRVAWQEPMDWVELLQARDRNFLFPKRTAAESSRGNYTFYEYGYYGDSQTLIKQLDLAEEHFVRFAFQQIFAPLGLADLALAQVDSATWSAARLTELGQRALNTFSGKEGKTVAEVKSGYQVTAAASVNGHEGRVVIQPNFQVLAMGPVPIATLAFLDRFAERRKADATVFEYYLTRQSVYEGLQQGLTIDQVENFLRQSNGNEIPQNVQRSLREWSVHHDRIIFRSDVTLLQTATPELLNLLFDDAKSGKYLDRTLTGQVALVHKGQVGKLQHALLAHAILPAISDDKPAAADHSILLNAAGEIRPIHSVPNLHLTGRLARVAENGKQGWRLTPTSVRKAGGNRKKVEELLTELGKLQRGEIPAALIDDIKKWGLYYGSATIDTLTLIEFSDRETLNDLLKHPKLKTLLIPFKAGDRSLVSVESKQIKQVRQILDSLGVEAKMQ